MAGAPDLVYYPDSRPGISRRRAGRGWSYAAPDGTTIDDAEERKRLNGLAVPPAYADVWISPRRRGHLQATGYDDRKRKQYRYHDLWAEWRAAKKFDGLAEFGEALPRLRARVAKGLGDEPGTEAFALAAITRLIDRTSARVGSESNLRENGTEGATTLRTRNLALDGDRIELGWRAKGGKRVRKHLTDATLARALHRLQDLPGAPLFEWLDGGEVRRIEAQRLNDWLREATGVEGATAKTFRTWNGSVAALDAALAEGAGVTVRRMSEAAADALHNTPSIARTSYVHPDVIGLAEEWRDVAVPDAPSGLRRTERALLGRLA
ncbi:DNA topoisomerase IB [Jannaschia sp. Os4]|uniref:DNA topoisomerase IB n=1 Tax=Jannaschia sp. Os4 TaxID=2807617 RepID=UPI00193A4197|nr:DNA topoisomerase IB [Jannaschia sp. Os4]MBM2575490.1 DNA topoisomerase IB [Jannaschia sp. Os4]